MGFGLPNTTLFGSNQSENLVDISNAYVAMIGENTYFVRRNDMEKQVQLVDIFEESVVHCCSTMTFVCALSSENAYFVVSPIKTIYPELENYSNSMVPKSVLEEQYQKASKREDKISKILKRD